MDLKKTYNKIAKDWHDDHKKDNWWIEGTNKFVSFFNKGDLILDVGCAGGIKSQHLIDNGLNVVGIDFSEKMIGIAKREVPKGVFEVKDLSEVDTINKVFNGIFMQAVLLHIPKANVKKVLQKMVSKLKQGGYFYVGVKAIKQDGIEEKVCVDEDYGYQYERFFSFFSLKEIKQYMEKSGLSIVHEISSHSGRANWIQVIAQKK